MAQDIKLQKVVRKVVIFEMGRTPGGVFIIGRVLDRRDIFDFHVVRQNHDTAGMLAGGTLDAFTARCQSLPLRS